jgi:hypothetical protein
MMKQHYYIDYINSQSIISNPDTVLILLILLNFFSKAECQTHNKTTHGNARLCTAIFLKMFDIFLIKQSANYAR